jgi:hypothetical protein
VSALSERWAAMSARDRYIAAALVGVLLAVVVFFAFFRGGGEEPVPFSGPTLTPRATPRATASPSPVPQTFDSFEGKDPFKPLVSAAGGGTPSPGATPTGTPSPGPTGGPSGQRVTLLEITTRGGVRYATVEVNDRSYTVKEGDTFAGSYRVIDLTSNCGTFVFGDERFTLCVGQEVLK